MQIEEHLILKQQEVANRLKLLEDSQFSSNEVAPESMELGTYAWEAETESTKEAVRLQLIKLSNSLQTTLKKIKQGTYGFCDKCKKEISKERLGILPTATLCVTCV